MIIFDAVLDDIIDRTVQQGVIPHKFPFAGLGSDGAGGGLAAHGSCGQDPDHRPVHRPGGKADPGGYAYESALIAESFRTAIPAALCFALGLLLCAAFLWQGFRGRWDAGLALAALAVFSLMLSPLAAVSFLGRYLPYPQTDWNALCRALRLTALLVFLGERGGGRLRWVLWCAAALHGLTALLGRSAAASPLTTVSEYVGLLGLVAASVLAMVWMKRENRFYRLFAPLFLAALGLGVAVWGVHALAEPQWGQELLLQLRTGFQMGLPRFLLWKLSLPALGAGVLAALIHLLQTEAERRTEARLLLQRGELAQENYENLR